MTATTTVAFSNGNSSRRHSLSKRLHHMKRIPELTFDYDEDVEKGIRIEELLDQIKHEGE